MARLFHDNKNFYFVLLLVIYILVTFQIMAPVSITNSLMSDLNINNSQLTFISAIFFLSYGIIQPVVGVLTDKFGEKKVLLISFSGFIAFSVLFSLSNSYLTALISRAILGLFSGSIFIPSLNC
jgi:MFS family permease